MLNLKLAFSLDNYFQDVITFVLFSFKKKSGIPFSTSYSYSFCTFSLKLSIFRSGKEAAFVYAPIAKIYFEKSSLKVFKMRLLLVVKEQRPVYIK